MFDGVPQFNGLLFIGDPHLEARVPGFRRDDYPQVALEKFRWSLRYAYDQGLQPILLGDLFQLPQDNPNWLMTEIIEAIQEPLPAIYGNHDVRENSLKPNDSINILFSSGRLRMLSANHPWIGNIAGRKTIVGGTVWGDKLPKEVADDWSEAAIVVWVTHHDILIPGYEEAGRLHTRELRGIDLIVNGHVHRRLPIVSKGATHWVTAGNITRRSRSDASRSHVPAVVRLDPIETVTAEKSSDPFEFVARRGDAWRLTWVEVPHRPFDEVFHPEMEASETESTFASAFIADLRELTARRTDTGAGLNAFLEQHLPHFEPDVAEEIRRLAAQVTNAN